MGKDKTMQRLLQARMQQIDEETTAEIVTPPGLQNEVFRTLDLIDTLGEVADLFTGKLVGSAADFIDLIENPDET